MGPVPESCTLYKPPSNGRYCMRYSIKGQGQQRTSSGATDPLRRSDEPNPNGSKPAPAEVGLSASRKQFEKIAEEFIAGIEPAVQRGKKAECQAKQYPMIVRKYFVGFFEAKLMSAIKD